MARTQELFSIGDVAQLFHLSVSSLRHYETIGLLTPEYTDPATGYRYYGPRQFEVLNTIRYLRALDMPLGQIRAFLRNRDVGRIEQLLREQKAAAVCFRGSHPEAPAQYARLMDYLRAHALAPADFSREITMIDYGLTSDPEKFVTEIRIPVTEA